MGTTVSCKGVHPVRIMTSGLRRRCAGGGCAADPFGGISLLDRTHEPGANVQRAFLITILLLTAVPLQAQSRGPCTWTSGLMAPPTTDLFSAWRRAAETHGDVATAPVVRRGSDRNEACPSLREQPVEWQGLAILPLTGRTVANSGYAFGRNDGALWSGKGLNLHLSAGAAFRWRGITAALAPEVVYSQNLAYPVVDTTFPNRSRFAYPWDARIDLPQRMGDERILRLHPGQSFIRADGYGVAGGISTENVWWGPGQRNSILLGMAAAGFPHVFLQTGVPIDIGIGRLEAGGIWGRVEEAEYFDTVPGNDRRLFTGARFAFRPSLLPGLTLGGHRVYQKTWPEGGATLRDLLPFFEPPLKQDLGTPENPTGQDDADQLLSLFGRWNQPGFEAYVEWSRNDHSWDLWDLISQPDHTQGLTVGFAGTRDLSGGWLRLAGEATSLTQSRTTERRRGGTYYTHGGVRQGYTHEGQLLGAWIGPGSDSRWLALDWFGTDTRWGGYVEHVRYNEDAFYERVPSEVYSYTGHDVELTGGVVAERRIGPLWLSGELALSQRANRLLRHCNLMVPATPIVDCALPPYRDRNVHLNVMASWLPFRS